MLNRKRLLDSVRGIKKIQQAETTTTTAPPYCFGALPSFALSHHHLSDAFSIQTPNEFHEKLCQMITNAKDRVHLASLYVGPAVDKEKNRRENEFLNALKVASAKSNVKIKMIMDKNRALRPVSLSSPAAAAAATTRKRKKTSSAEAVYDIFANTNINANTIHRTNTNTKAENKNELYLFSVLPPALQQILPNPYNEIMGVFHIKAYIIDDQLILSGANLSEEYFVDRYDRYFMVTNGGNGLVDFYDNFVFNILCNHAELYGTNTANTNNAITAASTTTTTQKQQQEDKKRSENTHYNYHTPTTRSQLLKSLNGIFSTTTTAHEATNDNDFFIGDDENEKKNEKNDAGVIPLVDASSRGNNESNDNSNGSNTNVLAYVVPTFQPPRNFFDSNNGNNQLAFLSDADATKSLLLCASAQDKQQHQERKQQRERNKSISSNNNYINNTISSVVGKFTKIKVRLSTAYINPTNSMIDALSSFSSIELLTAGSVSHGFKRKQDKNAPALKNDDSKFQHWVKGWIPKLFDLLSKEAYEKLSITTNDYCNNVKLYHYNRPGWTFHAKGLWIFEEEEEKEESTKTNESSDEQNQKGILSVVDKKTNDNNHTSGKNGKFFAAATIGSSNFNARSENLDMESNCFFILPKINPNNTKEKESTFNQSLQKEWNRLSSNDYCSSRRGEDNNNINDIDGNGNTKTASSTRTHYPWYLHFILPICRKLF